ncbi:Uncharacterised protein [Enterobacter hormaechei]|nr:Uncharacterised protein [Enterobacter hormaechei]CZV97923.1 Uncharacterised protein [Enterobacter hormaechei]CZX14138.1 Uncharacterised protein [Enterobacter hormaechei]CZY77635.1 Uncharacterised protein [Enterobacter hormaechei]CZY94265.1 Uncharacterised protein [Enterobacter hormaechei]
MYSSAVFGYRNFASITSVKLCSVIVSPIFALLASAVIFRSLIVQVLPA